MIRVALDAMGGDKGVEGGSAGGLGRFLHFRAPFGVSMTSMNALLRSDYKSKNASKSDSYNWTSAVIDECSAVILIASVQVFEE